MSNVSENLFQAMDIIIAERLNGLNYDKTILCKIEDDSKKDKGEYTVTDGSSTFLAISKDASYTKGSSVYVTVPTGDFNQQKLIVGKYIANNEEYATYQAPFELYIDITENLIEDDISTGLLANGDISEKLIWSWYKPQGQGLRGYSRLGFNAKFKSWLAALEPIAGTYGVRIDIEGTEKTTTEENDIHKNYKYFLTSDEFYGDPYNFDVFYKQEKVFDISKIAEITRIQITFYQDKGSFIDKEKDAIVSKDDSGKPLMDNLWIGEVSLSIGYATQDFDSDTVLLYTFDSLTYAAESETKKKADGRPLNEKNLKARWLHFDKEGRCTAIDNEEEMSEYEEDHNAKIHWYKHVLQDGVYDDLAGNFWQEVNDGQDSKNLLYRFSPDITAATETYKVIIEMPSLSSVNVQIDDETWNLYQKWGLENPTEENIKTWRAATGDTEDPDTGAILTRADAVLKIDEVLSELSTTLLATVKYYESETFVFENEAKVPDQATLELVQGLQITVDEVGLQGNYCVYGETGDILNPTEAYKMRTMVASYESLITNDKKLDKAAVIRWKIPVDGTMIYPPENGKEYIPAPKDTPITEDDENRFVYANRVSVVDGAQLIDDDGNLIKVNGFYIIERNGTENYPEDADGDGVQDTVEQIRTEQEFRILDYYTQGSTNNTVHCEIVKNGLTYKAFAALMFGLHGSNGTDATLKLKLKDNKPAIMKGEAVTVEAHLYDYTNTEVQIDEIDWDWFSTDGNIYWGHDLVLAKDSKTNQNELYKNAKKKYAISQDVKVIDEITGQFKYNEDGTPVLEKKEIFIHTLDIVADNKDAILHNILMANVKYGRATVGAQAVPGHDLTNVDQKTGEGADLPQKVEEREVVLTSFLPLAFRQSADLTWAEVPTRVVYNDQGKDPSYYKKAFAITTSQSLSGYITNADIVVGNDVASNAPYYPIAKYRDNESSAPGWYLIPNNMYISQLSEQVTLSIQVALSADEIYYWHQPILIIQNRWPSAMLNAWDGSLTIDEKNGTILSTMMGAGKKEEDNTFTGVLMGDIETGAGIKEKHLGVYGFNHGQQSFGLKDDGTAFFGKAGRGRIEFDGNHGQIKSMSYTQNDVGMLIDLDDGLIDIRGAKKIVDIDPDSPEIYTSANVYEGTKSRVTIQALNPYLTIQTENEYEIMRVGTDEYYLQSEGYADDDGVKTGAKLDIAKGIFKAYDIEGSGSYVQLSGNGDPFFRIHNETTDLDIFYAGFNTSENRENFYLQSSFYGNKKGMRVDLTDGVLTTYDTDGSGSYVKIDASDSSLFKIYYADTKTTLMNVGGGSYYLQSANYAEQKGTRLDMMGGSLTAYDKAGNGTYVKIDADGDSLFKIYYGPTSTTLMNVGGTSYYLQSAYYKSNSGMKLDLASGYLVAYDKSGDGSYVRIDGDGSPFFKIWDAGSSSFLANFGTGNYFMQSAGYPNNGGIKINFSVSTNTGKVMEGGLDDGTTNAKWYIQQDGACTFNKITATNGGKIGPFTISSTALYTGSNSISGTGVYLGSGGLGVASGKFQVDTSGNTTLAGVIKGVNDKWGIDAAGNATFENLKVTKTGEIGPLVFADTTGDMTTKNSSLKITAGSCRIQMSTTSVGIYGGSSYIYVSGSGDDIYFIGSDIYCKAGATFHINGNGAMASSGTLTLSASNGLNLNGSVYVNGESLSDFIEEKANNIVERAIAALGDLFGGGKEE